VPMTLMIIFVLLYLAFRRFGEALLIITSVPFALVGGIWFLYWMGFHMSLAVLTTLRLQFAAQMLSRGSQPLVVVAESVGYASESSFHKVFLREFGCTPGEYRKRVKALEV